MFDFFRSELLVEIFRSFFETTVLDIWKIFPFISFKNSKLILSFFGSSLNYLPIYLEPPLIPISMGYKKDIITG